MIRDQQHNNEVVKIENGFRVMPKDDTRPYIECLLWEDGFWSIDEIGGENDQKSRHRRTLLAYDFYRLVNRTVSALYCTWKPPQEKQTPVKDWNSEKIIDYFTPNKVQGWARKVTAKSLNHVIREIWQENINMLDSTVNDIHRLCFSLSPVSKYIDITSISDFIKNKDKFSLSDFYNYKAMRVVVTYNNSWRTARVSNYDNWMTAFSDDDTAYPSLRKTLMNLPNNIPYSSLMPALSSIHLPEPATTRVRLMAYTSMQGDYRAKEPFMKILLRSSDEEIKQAMHLVSKAQEFETTPLRSGRRMMDMISYMRDYDGGELGNWTLLGLAKRSIHYHRNIAKYNAMKQKEKFGQSTVIPPIPLPEDKHVKFLQTYGDVVQEGTDMNHCIAGYAPQAVSGSCFLFHVDYKGHKASVEINRFGQLVQAQGVRNTQNKATAYGKRVLGQWCSELEKAVTINPVQVKEIEYDFTHPF